MTRENPRLDAKSEGPLLGVESGDRRARMFPVERTPHAKKAAQVRRTMAEMYEDPQEKQK